MWTYRAELDRVIDGDTVDLEIDLGFKIKHRVRVRLKDVDTPELRGAEKEEGKRYKQAVIDWFMRHGDKCYLKTEKTGKYGRWIGTIWGENDKTGEPDFLEIFLKWMLGQEGGQRDGRK